MLRTDSGQVELETQQTPDSIATFILRQVSNSKEEAFHSRTDLIPN